MHVRPTQLCLTCVSVEHKSNAACVLLLMLKKREFSLVIAMFPCEVERSFGPMIAVHMSDLQQLFGNRRGLEFANFLR